MKASIQLVGLSCCLMTLAIAEPAAAQRAESHELHARELKCRRCPNLVRKATIRRAKIQKLDGERIVAIQSRQAWTTVRYEIVGAGPACSQDPFKAALAARLVEESIHEPEIDLTLTDSIWRPNVTLIASGPSSDSESWVKRVTASVFSPVVPEDRFETIRQSVLSNIAGVRGQPSKYAYWQAMGGFVYPDVAGLSDEAQKLEASYSLNGIQEWHHRYYTPSHLKIGIVSPASHALLRSAPQLSNSDDQPTCRASRNLPFSVPPLSVPRYAHISAETKFQTVYIVGSTPLEDRRDRLVLLIANKILGGGPESRFRKVIRDTNGLSYDISSSFDWGVPGVPWVITATSPDDKFGVLIDSIYQELESLVSSGPTETELIWTKESLVGARALASQDPIAGLNDVFDGLEDVTLSDPRLESISRTDVANLVSRVFLSGNCRVVVVGPQSKSTSLEEKFALSLRQRSMTEEN